MAKKPAPIPKLIADLDAKLAPLGHFLAKRMFGGHGVYLDDVVFGLIFWDKLWLRVDDRNRADFEKAGMEPFTYEKSGGKPISITYWECPAKVLKDGKKLRDWVAKSKAASAERKKSKKRKVVKKKAGDNPFL